MILGFNSIKPVGASGFRKALCPISCLQLLDITFGVANPSCGAGCY